MRRLRLLAVVTLCLLGAPWCLLGPPGGSWAADPGDLTPSDRTAIRQVIQSQLGAFRRDDGAAAFSFASPGIQAQFGDDPASFMEMVRRGYQPVYRPRATAFGPLAVEGGQVVQRLDVIGPDGADYEAQYFMEHEADGTWRISGCVLTDGGTVGA